MDNSQLNLLIAQNLNHNLPMLANRPGSLQRFYELLSSIFNHGANHSGSEKEDERLLAGAKAVRSFAAKLEKYREGKNPVFAGYEKRVMHTHYLSPEGAEEIAIKDEQEAARRESITRRAGIGIVAGTFAGGLPIAAHMRRGEKPQATQEQKAEEGALQHLDNIEARKRQLWQNDGSPREETIKQLQEIEAESLDALLGVMDAAEARKATGELSYKNVLAAWEENEQMTTGEHIIGVLCSLAATSGFGAAIWKATSVDSVLEVARDKAVPHEKALEQRMEEITAPVARGAENLILDIVTEQARRERFLP